MPPRFELSHHYYPANESLFELVRELRLRQNDMGYRNRYMARELKMTEGSFSGFRSMRYTPSMKALLAWGGVLLLPLAVEFPKMKTTVSEVDALAAFLLRRRLDMGLSRQNVAQKLSVSSVTLRYNEIGEHCTSAAVFLAWIMALDGKAHWKEKPHDMA